MGNFVDCCRGFWCRTKNPDVRISLPGVCFVWQIAMIILFGLFVRYDEESDAHWYVMIFVGFGFLMTFLKRYSFGGVGFNFLIAAFGLQWALLMQGWFHSLDPADGTIKIGIENLINADFCVAGCLIAYGALLGKVSPVQLMVLTLFGITLFAEDVSSYRDPLPLDVLAQFQLCHLRSWRRSTPGGHKHLPCSGFLCTYYICHIQPFCFVHLGAYPKCNTGWGCGHGNRSRVHDHTLRFSHRGLLLWDFVHVRLPGAH